MTLTTPRPLTLSVPSTQNTAPILEFRCLYTHDIRRKSKRWQDGFLRFHTFNKRVMVYDLPRNFVGDSHWRETNELTDGDEFELERHGILVQVGEALGKTEQDLTVLFEKRVKDRGQKLQGLHQFKTPLRSSSAARAFSPPVGRTPNPTSNSNRTLNSIPRTPSHNPGQVTWPGRSPFEQRHGSNEGGPKERRSKKRKVRDEEDPRSSNPAPGRGTEIQEKPTGKKPRRKAIRTNGGLGSIVIVDVPDDERPSHEQSNPSEQLEEPRNVTAEVQSVHNPQATELLQKSANPLRLAGRPARKKLLCQDLPSPTRPTPTSGSINNAPHPHRQSPSPPPSSQSEEISKFHQAQTERLQARLKRRKEGRKDLLPPEQERAKAPQRDDSYSISNPQTTAKQSEAPYGRTNPPRITNTRTPAQQYPRPHPLNYSLQQKQKPITQRPTNSRPQPISRQGSMNEPADQAVGGAADAMGAWSIEICDLFDWRRPT